MCSWDTRKMTFGAGTKLFVEPQHHPPVKPSVFIMKNGTNVACLVKDFYPKNVNISLQSSKKIIEFDHAVAVTPSGNYTAIKLGRYADSNSVTCSVQHNNEIVKATYTEPNTQSSTGFEPKTNTSDNPKPVETENIQQISGRCPELKVHAEKVNLMSLTVLGLRMLLAKTVAANFLLTAKLFFL